MVGTSAALVFTKRSFYSRLLLLQWCHKEKFAPVMTQTLLLLGLLTFTVDAGFKLLEGDRRQVLLFQTPQTASFSCRHRRSQSSRFRHGGFHCKHRTRVYARFASVG